MKQLASFWRWKVVLAKFLVSLLAFGIYKSFGVLLPYLVDGLEIDVISLGWVYGLYGGFIYLLSPVAGALTQVYGARPVVMFGGIMAAVGLTLASTVSSSTYLCLAFACAGVGHGLTILPSVQPITVYFTTEFALANGIALGGASIGTMILPPVTEQIIGVYGWRGALLIIGALDFNIVVAGAMMKLPEDLSIRQNCNGYNTLKQDEENQKVKGCTSSEKETSLSLSKLLAKSFDVELFALEPIIVFYDVIIFLFALVFSTWTIFLIPHAIERGVSPGNASLLSTVAGFTNFFGRVLCAPLVDQNILDSRTFFALLSGINTVIFIADPLFDSYPLMSLSAAIAGLVIGAGNSLWTMMIKQFVDECGTGSFVGTLGWACMFSGLGSLVSSPITGFIYERLHDYDLVFQMMGVISAVIFTLLGASRLSHKYIS